MNTITISQLAVKTHIGVHTWEQKIRQTLLIDITIGPISLDTQDNLSNTLDYDSLCQTVTDYCEKARYQLIESLASALIDTIKSAFKPEYLSLSISKPNAIAQAKNVTLSVAL